MGTPAIELRGVRKAFGEQVVLRQVDLRVERGTTCVVMGESGSGKSVLIKLVIGLLEPDAGQVLIEGVDLAGLAPKQLEHLREDFGMVFQESALFDGMTVFDNVAFPMRIRFPHLRQSEIARRVHEKLELFDLRDVDAVYPEELSGGMKKRVALARAIALDPKYVLYDEPITGLDPISSESVTQMIIRAKRTLGVTSVVICQDLASAFEMADQVAFLDHGRICAHGTPEEMRASHEPAVHRFLSLWEESKLAWH